MAEKMTLPENRDRMIVKAGFIGIITNVLLAAFKAGAGIVSGSIAITLDAVNNLSDAASSIITIIGTKLAGKPADKKHPFGYGRAEYLSALVIAVIVLYAGITAFAESVKKIVSPEIPDYSAVSLVIIGTSVIVKIFLGKYVRSIGEKVNSDSLVNSGKDAILDSVISASVLAAALLYMFTGLSLEAWLGAVIAAVIIKSGIEMLRETLSEILGERADAELAADIRKTVCSFPDVMGAYDLVLNNYGPDRFTGSVHIEIPDTYSADRIDVLNRAIAAKVFEENNVILTAVGVYSMNTSDPDSVAAKEKIGSIVFSHENVIQMHAFYLDKQNKTIRFDLVISFDEKDRTGLIGKISEEISREYPEYALQILADTDFSESM